MKVILDSGETVNLGETEATPTIGIVDYSRRVTDDYGVTTVVERDFARRMSVRLVVPFDQTDALQRNLAAIRAKPARWIADEGVDWLDFRGFFKDFEIDLPVPPKAYCTLTVEALAATEAFADPGGDPAPLGHASTLQLLQPATIEGGALVATTVPENDYPEWAAGTTYPLGARVIKAATHRIYESGSIGNVGNDPAGTSGKWRDIGPTNRWAMFDQALGSTTTAAGQIAVTLSAGAVDALALLDVKAATVRVQSAGYDRTLAPNASGTVTFLDMPETVGQAVVTIAGPGTVEVGTLLVGKLVGLGSTTEDAKAGITDFSRKEADDFGDIQVVERAWAKRATIPAKIRRDAIDLVAGRIAAVRAKPALWIGKEGMETLTVYGFFKDFSIQVDTTICTLSLSIEGLSTAGKVEPLTASVAWPDITDPNGTKPDDNATRNVNRGDWAPGVAYNVGDFFQYGGSSYTVITAHVSAANLPPPNQYVSLLASAGAEGEKGDKGDPGAKGDAGSNGAAGEAAITPSLTSPAYQVWAYANGIVKSYDGATTTFVLKQGGVDISASFNMVIAANPNGLQVSLSGRTATVVGATGNAGEFGNTNVLGATLTLRAIGTGAYVGRNFDLNFTLGKLLGGYEIVGALPTTNNFEGRIVYSNTDGKLYTYTNGAWKTGVNAADIAGDIVADQFAPTIEPLTLVTAVPAVKSTNVVFNQTDGKTYRWNGSAYVATVAAADVSGGLTAAQFAAGIEPVTLVSGGLPTTRITNVITYGGKLYRWNGAAYVATTAATDLTGTLTSAQIASLDAAKLAGQIVGTQITDGAVSTAKLAAGSVTAGQIAAGSILASKMAITGENLWPDPQCQDIDWWKGPSQGALTSAFGYVNPTNPSNNQSAGWQFVPSGLSAFSDRVGGSKGMWQLWSGNNNDQFTSGAIAQVVPPSIWAKGNTTYEIGVGCFNSSNKPVNFTVNMVNAAGAIINTVTPIVWSAGDTSTRYYKAKIKTTADTVSIRLYFEVPAGAAFSGAVNVGNISIREAAGGTMIVDGSITAGHIAADTITAAQIAAGAVSASELAAGAVTTAKLAVVPNNLIPDPYFADTAWWTGTRLDAGGWYFEDNTNPAGAATGMGVPKILVLGPQNSLRKHCWSASVPFSGQGQVVRLRAMGSNSTSDRMYLTVRFRGPAGDLGDLGVNWEPGAGINLLRSAQMVVPTGTTHYQVIAFNEGNTNTGGWMWIGAPKLDIAASADLLVDGSITASKIAADTITAGQIAAGAISSSEIAAGAVTAAKMTVAEFENLFLNGDLASGNLDGWSRNYNGVDGMIIQCEDGGIGTGWPSRYVLHMLRNGRTGVNELSITNGLGTWDNNDKRFGIPVNPGDEFAFETTCWCSNGAMVQFDMIMLNTSGSLEWMACEPVQNTFLNSTTNMAATPGEGYVVLKGTFKYVGTNQGRANVRFIGPTPNTPNAHCYFWNSKMRRRNKAELIVDGNITAAKLAASAVTADKISAGAVTAGKIAVTELSSITANLGLMRTATAGRRTEIDSNGMRAYDANGTLRVRAGVWAV